MAEPILIKEVTRPFNDFTNPHKFKILATIMKAIDLVTQKQPEQFFEFLLNSPVGKKMILPKVYELKVKPVMKTICDHYETAVQAHKLSILSMVATHFPYDELVSFGFPIVRSQYEVARAKHKKKSRSTNPVKKLGPSVNKTPDSVLVKIIECCLENSKKSRAKRVYPSKVEHLNIPGYDTKKNYDLKKTKKDLHSDFKAIYPDSKMGLSTFYSLVPPNFIALKVPPKPPSKQPGDQHQLENLNQANDTSSRSSSNHSNLAGDVVNQPPPSNSNHSNSESVMGVSSLPSNLNDSNSANIMWASSLPSNLNYSNYSNSASNMGASSLPSNPNHSKPDDNLISPHPPYNSHYPNSTSNMSVPPPPYNPKHPNPTSNIRAPSLPSNPNQSNSTSNTGAQSPPPPTSHSNSSSGMSIPHEVSGSYHPSQSYDTQRPF